MTLPRIHMSVPHMGGDELAFVHEAFASNWLSTVGPNLTAFEAEFSAQLAEGLPALALGSGTAAIHLALRLLGVGPGDEVMVSDLTFVASVNPIVYQGARPVFVDSERSSWNMDPALVAETLDARARRGRLPKAIVVVHLYGQMTDMDPILAAAERHGVPVVEDAAEAVGSTYKGRRSGTLGVLGAYSFNGNKIITTTGGGMLVGHRKEHVDKARFWSTQAREPGPAYHHLEVGYNYRLSNVLAGIGRGQLRVLDQRVAQRRAVAFRYRDAFADLPGLSLMPEAPFGLHTYWLSVFQVDPREAPARRDDLLAALERENIEARPVWKPMHLQPLYADAECIGGDVSGSLFENGICLPSSSSMTPAEQDRVIDVVRGAFRSR